MAEPTMDGLTGPALGAVGGAVVTGFFGWLKNRNKLDSATASAMINKLWEQNAELARKVGKCEDQHRECEAKAARLEARVEDLREDLNELRRRIDRSDLME
jgi:chromosome segregation ATPase